jgi:transcription elongation factor Elf1
MRTLTSPRGRCLLVPLSVRAKILYRLNVEHTFDCPYCGEEISMVLDTSVPRQTYVEDCEVCCHPIEISFTVEDDSLSEFNAKTFE